MRISTSHTPSPIISGIWRNSFEFPHRLALKIQETEYTYSELRTRILQYYTFLEDSNESRIAFVNRDDFDSYARLLAISLIGASYIPIHEKWPEARKQEVLHSLNLVFVLDSEDIQELREEADPEFLSYQKVETDEAYILFTSGSTGKPKGVPLSKSNIQALLNYYLDESKYDFSCNDKFLQSFELTFDFSIFPLLMAFEHGASLHVMDFKAFRFLQIPDLIEKEQLTVLTMVPSVLSYLEKYMDEFTFPSVRYSLFGGAPLYLQQAEKWKVCLPNGEIRNVYGPTETGVICTDYQSDQFKSKSGMVAMGYLFPSFDYQILKGELFLSGPQVFNGYLDASLNRFIEKDGRRYYGTGDLVSMDDDGLLYFEGRKDFQVKLDGFRIELEEIEARVNQQFNIQSMALVIEEVLMLIVDGQKEEISSWMKTEFPSYMIPKRIVEKEVLILNQNLKIDRQANKEWLLENWK